MADFDASAARAAGYSEADITRIQSRIAAARAAGYSDAEISSHLAGGAPAAATVTPAPGYIRWPLGAISAAGAGLARTAGLPGDIAQLGEQYIINPLHQAITGRPDPLLNAGLHLPSSEQTLAAARYLGVGSPWLAPQSSGERLFQAGIEGVAGAAPLLAMGMPPISTLASGATSGLASQGAAELGLPPAAQIGAGLLAGGATQGVASLAARKVAHIAADLGSSSTLQEAGSALQADARDWINSELPRREALAWAPVDAAIPPTTPVPQFDFENTVRRLSTNLGANRELIEDAAPAMVKRWNDIISSKPPTAQVPNWQDSRLLRSAIGGMMRRPSIVANVGQDSLDALYASLNSDLERAASGAGALPEFQAANAESNYLRSFKDNVLSRITSSETGARELIRPEDAANAMLVAGRRGGTHLSALRAELPDATDELAAAHLRLHPDGKAWSQLSPEAQAALVSSPSDRAIITRTAVRPGDPTLNTRLLETLSGASVGDLIGMAASPLLHDVNPLVAGAVTGLGAAALPWAWAGGRAMARNPLALAPGVLGARATPSMSYSLPSANNQLQP